MSIKHWSINHTRAFLFSLGETFRTPFVNLLTFLVIGIAMALPAGLYVVLQNVQAFNKDWNNTPSISLYLKKNLTSDEVQNLQKNLYKNPQIKTIKYISPQQGITELGQQQQLGDTLSTLNNNPLPGVMVITPQSNETPDQLQQLLSSLNQLPLVNIGQLNITWVKRLYDIIQIGKNLTYILGILFGVGVILVIANTVRLIMQNKRAEINVMKLIGARPSFIRRPLLYRGFFFGLFGGMIAWVFVYLTLWWLAKPANALAQTYTTPVFLQGVSTIQGISIVFVCAL
nr:permease-like cell division protein FtsX [Gammaproteobacteria bacterium]